jgi:hypothetical protein
MPASLPSAVRQLNIGELAHNFHRSRTHQRLEWVGATQFQFIKSFIVNVLNIGAIAGARQYRPARAVKFKLPKFFAAGIHPKGAMCTWRKTSKVTDDAKFHAATTNAICARRVGGD